MAMPRNPPPTATIEKITRLGTDLFTEYSWFEWLFWPDFLQVEILKLIVAGLHALGEASQPIQRGEVADDAVFECRYAQKLGARVPMGVYAL